MESFRFFFFGRFALKEWEKSLLFAPPAAGSRAGRGTLHVPREAREEEGGPFARCSSRIEVQAGPSRGETFVFFY